MLTNRRDVLLGAGAVAAVGALPAIAFAKAKAVGPGDARLEKLLAEVAEAILAEYPENASALGIDKGARAALKSRLTDRSPAGNAAPRGERRGAAGAAQGGRQERG